MVVYRLRVLLGCLRAPVATCVSFGMLAQRAPAESTSGKRRQGAHDQTEVRNQYTAAMAWMQAGDGRTAYAAANMKDNAGQALWPLVNEKGLRKRVAGEIDNDDPHASSRVLSPADEEEVVAVCRVASEAGPLTQGTLSDAVLALLKAHSFRGEKLSFNARQVLKAGRCQKDFFLSWDKAHPDLAVLAGSPYKKHKLENPHALATAVALERVIPAVEATAKAVLDQGSQGTSMCLREKSRPVPANLKAQVSKTAKSKPATLERPLYFHMARSNASVLGGDMRWGLIGACPLKPLPVVATELLKFLTSQSNLTPTGQLRVLAGGRSFGGYNNWFETHATVFDADEQKGHTVVFEREHLPAAMTIKPLAAAVQSLSAQVQELHGTEEVQLLRAHVLDQTSPLAQFTPHQDTTEQYHPRTGVKDCEVWYTALMQLDKKGVTAMEVIGCPMAAEYAGAGTGFIFRSELWHQTLHAKTGVWKLALFFGKAL